jgi:cytosine/adenosine deaminase-related metal-dependent hydrolase
LKNTRKTERAGQFQSRSAERAAPFALLSRQDFLRLAGGAIAAASFPSAGAAAPPAKTAKGSVRGRTLIRGADVLTMDPALGELKAYDVLIDQGRIAKVAKGLDPAGARVWNASGMILMPGLVDGHRHTWQSILMGTLVRTSKRSSTYFEFINEKCGVAMRPDDVYLGNYLGGLLALNNGVTSLVDHSHICHTREKGEAAAKGLKDSGIGGFFCYQITFSPTYGPGTKVSATEASNEFHGAPDEAHFQNAVLVRDRYFASGSDPLQFGVGLSNPEFAPRTVESIRQEMSRAQTLGARLITQHVYGTRVPGLPESYRVITGYQNAGLLCKGFHVSHGTLLNDEEIKMLRDAGAGLCALPAGEQGLSPLVRARHGGLPAGIGVDVTVQSDPNFFEVIRASFASMGRTPEGRKLTQSMESADVLDLATLGGARAIGMDGQVGSITPGKRADLVLLKTDRLDFAAAGTLADRVVNFARPQDVDTVWVAGNALKRNGAMVGVDWPRLRARMLEAQAYAVEKAGQIEFTRD